MQENYFILLGLPFDPIETDENKIKAAIDAKVLEWQKDSRNPKKAVKAKEYLQSIEQIKEVMLNPSNREEEAFQAQAVYKKKLKDAQYEILIKSTKGFVKESEITSIAYKYNNYCITYDDIEGFARVPIYSDDLLDAVEGNTSELEIIDASIANQLETYFDNIGSDNVSIYDFFEQSNETPSEKMLEIAEHKLQFVLQKGTKTTSDEITQKIAGIAKNIFSSKEEKEKYDNYLSGCKYIVLNHLIADGAEGNEGIINAKLYNLLTTIMCNDFNMSRQEASKYIIANIKINGFKLDKDVLSQTAEPIQVEVANPEESKTITEEIEETFEEFEAGPNDYEQKIDSRDEKLNRQEQVHSESQQRVEHSRPIQTQQVTPPNNSNKKTPPDKKPAPKPEKSEDEMTPEELRRKNPIKYVNEFYLKEAGKDLTEVSKGITKHLNEANSYIDKAVNEGIIPGQKGMYFALVSLGVSIVVNLILRKIFISTLSPFIETLYLALIAVGIAYFCKVLFYFIKTYKVYKSFGLIKEYYKNFETLCDKEFCKKDMNSLGTAEGVIEHVDKLKKVGNQYLDGTIKHYKKFAIAINKQQKPKRDFYFELAGVAGILITVVIIVLFLYLPSIL